MTTALTQKIVVLGVDARRAGISGGVEIHQKDAAMLVLPLRGEHDGLRLVLQEGSVAYRLIWVGIGECLVLVGGEGREEYSLI